MSTGQAAATSGGPSNKVLVICAGQVAVSVAWFLWLLIASGPTTSDLTNELQVGSFFAGLPFWAAVAGLDLWLLRRASAVDTWLIATGLIVTIFSAFIAGCVTATYVLFVVFPI